MLRISEDFGLQRKQIRRLDNNPFSSQPVSSQIWETRNADWPARRGHYMCGNVFHYSFDFSKFGFILRHLSIGNEFYYVRFARADAPICLLSKELVYRAGWLLEIDIPASKRARRVESL